MMKLNVIVFSLIIFVIFMYVNVFAKVQNIPLEERIDNSDLVALVHVKEGVSKDLEEEFLLSKKYDLGNPEINYSAIVEIIKIFKGETKYKHIVINYSFIAMAPSPAFLEKNKYYILLLKETRHIGSPSYEFTYQYYGHTIYWEGEKSDDAKKAIEKLTNVIQQRGE